MDLQLAVADIAERYQLTPHDRLRLADIAAVNAEPDNMKRTVLAGVGILGAALSGLGVIFWIAANWDSLGRFGQFALLQALIVAMCAGAILRPQARLPLSLIALLAVGGLFAYFGQTYQTGADPWQLFAVWSLLILPLCLSLRHDVAWAPWCLVTLTAISLWVQVHLRASWGFASADLPYHLVAWIGALLLCGFFSPALRHWTGAGVTSLRVALTLAVFMVGTTAFAALFDNLAAQFWLGLFLLAGAAAFFAQPRMLDIFALSILGLALNTLLIGLLVYVLIDVKMELIFGTLLTGIAAASLLSLTVKFILGLARQPEQGEAA